MYMLNHIRRVEVSQPRTDEAMTHRFWLIERGSGGVLLPPNRSESGLHKIKRGTCLMLAPGDCAQFKNDEEQVEPMTALEISFDYLEELSAYPAEPILCDPILGERHFAKRIAPLPRFGLLPTREAGGIVRAATRLSEYTIKPDDARHAATTDTDIIANRRMIGFQQLIALLLKLNESSIANTEPELTDIGRTVNHMRRHYGEELTRDTLAAVAGLSPWYYSVAFRREMGCTPMTYLNDMRMRRAREKLILGKESIPEIAENCGFRDETYFRRRFKASSGATPLAFGKQNRERIADMSYAYVTHLLALDLTPCAAMVDPKREFYRQPYHSLIDVHLQRSRVMTPHMWAHNLDLLKQASPELIICDDGKETQAYGGELEQIAPCLYIPWKSLDWRSQLRSLAAYTRRERQAEEWLDHYEAECSIARMKLEPLIEHDTVLLLRVTGDQLAVYGLRNAGAVLYGDLGLNCPYDAEGIEIERLVDLPFLNACDPDHLLLVVDQDAPSAAHWAKLQRTPEWLELRAVRKRNVYRVPELPLLEYSPLAHLWVVRHLPQLLSNQPNAQFSV